MARRDESIRHLLDQFVTVRIVQANALDLTLFDFDFDLTFAVFFLNADKTIYGRFGTRSDREAVRDISMEGFRRALEGALGLHADYPKNRAALAGKRATRMRVRQPERFPSLKKYGKSLDYDGAVAKSCMHCHQVRAAARAVLREARKPMPDEVLFPWPMPDAVGLSLDPKECATVARAAGVAEKAGFRAGDRILSLAGQPLLSIADVQWVLDTAGAPARIPAVVERKGERVELTLPLEKDWRRGSDISWRTTTWDLRRMAFGGMVLEPAPGADGKSLRLRVKHVGRYGQHAVAMRAGVRKGDIVVGFAGWTDPMTESELLARVLTKKPAGTRVDVALLRDGKRIETRIRLQ